MAYRRWTLAGLVSVSGTWMQQVAQSWLVLERTGSGTAVGLTIAVQAGPALCFGVWGGALVDRSDRRRLLQCTQAVNALLAIALGLLVATGHASLLTIECFAVATGLVAVLDGPASGTFTGDLLPAEDLANGLALGSVVTATGRVIGLALAGVAVAVVGVPTAFLVNGLSFVAPLIVLSTLPSVAPHPTTSAPRRAIGRDVREGVAHVWENTEARVTIATAWLLGCFGRNFQVTMALMAARAFGSGAGLYGRFSSLFAFGAMAGSLAATRLSRMTRRVLAGAAVVAGSLQILSGLATTSGLFGLLLVPIAAGAVVLDTATATRVQLSTDPPLRGRVLAISGIAAMTAGMVGAPLLGTLGQALGPRAPLVVGGTVAVAATAMYAALRRGRPDPVHAAYATQLA